MPSSTRSGTYWSSAARRWPRRMSRVRRALAWSLCRRNIRSDQGCHFVGNGRCALNGRITRRATQRHGRPAQAGDGGCRKHPGFRFSGYGRRENRVCRGLRQPVLSVTAKPSSWCERHCGLLIRNRNQPRHIPLRCQSRPRQRRRHVHDVLRSGAVTAVTTDATLYAESKAWNATFTYNTMHVDEDETVPPPLATVTTPMSSLTLHFSAPYDPATIGRGGPGSEYGERRGRHEIRPSHQSKFRSADGRLRWPG